MNTYGQIATVWKEYVDRLFNDEGHTNQIVSKIYQVHWKCVVK